MLLVLCWGGESADGVARALNCRGQDLQTVAEIHFSTCVKSGCSSAGGYSTDVAMAIGLYDGYCNEMGYIAIRTTPESKATTTTAATGTSSRTSSPTSSSPATTSSSPVTKTASSTSSITPIFTVIIPTGRDSTTSAQDTNLPRVVTVTKVLVRNGNQLNHCGLFIRMVSIFVIIILF
ncbi:uncharacterized protein BDR25DRAFT_385948 [Lindgomyces ingoldianus]|uniref:Uncharacterized protein n=1 Tax=Lindgomyces ingoldianus TaxID=673940 RepID=A0ACB6R540_9PLEO|nr:uncharacterized protein BDR25DRAFT_385948 [Lindgomyces ingoldianus]KAF2474388.1 hypothetical protein BDR25DRAFT_385948 [Lindgomyces ingoldianus]